MKNLVLIIAHLCLSSCITDDKKGVRICFETYKQAVLKNDGATAVKQIDKCTIDWYRKILLMTLTYDSARLEKESYMKKVNVLISRHFIDRTTLSKMDGPNLFSYLTEIGLTDKKALKGITVKDIKITGDRALLTILSGKGEVLRDIFSFYHEDGRWKINLSEIDEKISEVYEKDITELGPAQVNANLMVTLEEMNGEPVSPDIWKPMK
jgi:hypothetical protein